MKKLVVGFTVLALVALFVGITVHDASAQKKVKCVTIQSGTLFSSDGSVLTTGYDKWGYNYQAHLFNGYYCDADRNAAWCQAWKDDRLNMKWNDAWLSNQDCDGDGLLDRHYGFPTYVGSGAWLTNHMWGTYIDADGKEAQWSWFTKIVAVPANAYLVDGVWFVNGEELGPSIWGEFATVQIVNNDPSAGFHGIEYLSPVGPGLGKWKQ